MTPNFTPSQSDEKKVVLWIKPEGGTHGHMIYCPACQTGHLFDSRWTFNGDPMKPTFGGSMLVFQGDPERQCHSYVTNGMIQFLDDCGHALRGQTIPLEAIY